LNREQVVRQYAAMAAAHHVAFLNYSESAPSENQSLFYNSQHLNRRGAAAFTTILAADLADVMRADITASRIRRPSPRGDN
jgi:hypothetical protein